MNILNLLPFGKDKNSLTKEKNSTNYRSYFLYGDEGVFLDYTSNSKLAYEGFIKNIITYKCITLIVDQAKQLKYVLHTKNKKGELTSKLDAHESLNLLRRPYPGMSETDFKERLFAQYLIYGINYIQKLYKKDPGIYQSTPPMLMYPVRPDQIQPIEGAGHMNSKYIYTPQYEESVTFQVNKYGQSNLMIMKKFNPMSDYTGLSPVIPAGYSIDTHNAACKWNYSLLRNGAKPSGILTVPADVELEESEMLRIKARLEAQTGPDEAGKPILLEGGMTWQQISIDPDKMSHNETERQAAYKIALAWGVPMELLNMEHSKFENKRTAYRQLYEDAVLPLVGAYMDTLNMDYIPLFGDDLYVKADMSHTMVMQDAQNEQMEKLEKITFLTKNEKREKLGYEKHPDGEGLGEATRNPEAEQMIAEEVQNGASIKEAIEMTRLIYGE